MAKILLIDDEAEFREIFSTKLKAAGFSVETAEDALRGIAQARASAPDLILMDIKMPGTTGVEAIAKLKEDHSTKNIKIAVLTSDGATRRREGKDIEDKIEAEYLKMGAVSYLEKADDLDMLVQKVKLILSK